MEEQRPKDRSFRFRDSNDTKIESSAGALSGFGSQETKITPAIGQKLYFDPDLTAIAMYYASHCVEYPTAWSPEQIRAQGNGCLFAAIKTSSTLEIDKQWYLPGGSTTVMQNYVNAIELLNAALASPLESQRDSTLLATLVMSAIEMKAAPSRSSTYWEKHTIGAAALLQIRGIDQVTTPLGSSLFFHVSSQLMMTCILAKRPVPRELWRLREAVATYLIDEDHPVWRYQGVMLRSADLIAAFGLHSSQRRTSQDLILEAFSIYTEISSILSNADASWQYAVVPITGNDGLLQYEQVFHSVPATQLWNGFRIAIVTICTIVASVRVETEGDQAIESDLQWFLGNAPSIANQTALDIIAAVPQALALIASRAAQQPPIGRRDICDKGIAMHDPVFQHKMRDSQDLPLVHGCLLQWSVYFAAQSELVDKITRKRLWEILDRAGRMMQVKQWQMLAEQLRPELHQVA